MIYAFYSDRTKVLRQIRKLESAARARAPEAPVLALDAAEDPPETLNDLLGARGLFYERSLIRIAGAWENKNWRTLLEAAIPQMAADVNWYLLWGATEPPKKIKELLYQHAERVVEVVEEAERPVVYAFAVGRLWCEGKRAQAWATLRRALAAAEAPEQIAGALLWQLRAALAYARGAKREVPHHALPAVRAALARWGEEGVRERYETLLALYHSAHQGDTPLSEGLELCVLEHPGTL
ncbi:MAG: hypothetical protein KatS3mg100_198 [Candidatus Parcubacteria bacterium]|nr:MAG: hypothetical protein KatS3mg100_198 [Candidatus Parcubacteria bacterium]